MSSPGSGRLRECGRSDRVAGAEGEASVMGGITPCLWFDTQAEKAAAFYVSVFKNSRILETSYFGEAGPREAGMVLTVEFELDGQPFTALNGGAQFTLSAAVSFQATCAEQPEVHHYWDALIEGGGEPSQCGWL